MKNIATAFSMAWGNFTVLPCPYKRWNSKLNNMMLALLPVIGAVIGGLWLLLWWILDMLGIPAVLTALAMTYYIYRVCGFMHLDGFMDCTDAIMSRRDLPERQRILKDSTVGAFAVVGVVFLILAFFACMMCSVEGLSWGCLLVLPMVSRTASGICVLCLKPIGHSQYNGTYIETGKGGYVAAMLLMLAVCLSAAALASDMTAVLITAAAAAAAAVCAALYARRNLGGMSGDIAGYSICVGELAGVIAMALLCGGM